MRAFRSHAARRPISVLCILSVCLTLCATVALSPSSVQAQVAGITQVAVIDFRNASSMPGQMFGRMATDAVVLELIRSGKFGVIPSDTLEATMKQLGYDANMNQSAMVRLGQEAEATSVVSGELLSVKIDKDKKKAEARIAVKLVDVASGEVVNGAVAAGISQPRIGYTADDDKMVVEAIRDAARNAVETLVSYIIPEATVLNSIGTSSVLLNKGSQEGLEPGMEMIVLRRMEGGQEEVVGRIKISHVSESDATASILKAPRGVKPEDRVRAVYKMPDYSSSSQISPPKRVSRQGMNRGKNLMWALAAAVILGVVMKPGSSDSPQLPGAVAMAARSPILGYEGHPATEDGSIVLAWNTPNLIRRLDIKNFVIKRNGRVVAYLSPTETPELDAGAAGKFDFYYIDRPGPKDDISYEFPEGTEHEYTGIMGPEEGVVYSYQISAIYERARPSDGTVALFETDPVNIPYACALAAPVCVMPDNVTDVPMSSVTFEWEPSTGADLYRIEVSTDPAFLRSNTFCKDIRRSEAPNFEKTLNLAGAPELASVTDGQELFWRVGARRMADNPGPYPDGLGGAVAVSGSNNTRFIYSDYLSFRVADLPPGPGGDDGGDPGDDDDGGPPPPPQL